MKGYRKIFSLGRAGLFLLLWQIFPLHAQPLPDLPARMAKAMRTVRNYIAHPKTFTPDNLQHLRFKLESLAEEEPMAEFSKFVLGHGLLHIDVFRLDLTYAFHELQADESGELAARLRAISFDKWAATFVQGLEETSPAANANLLGMEEATFDNLRAQDSFIKSREKQEFRLWVAHSSLVLALVYSGVYLLRDLIHLADMRFQDQVTSITGLGVGAVSSYYLVWEHFRWIDPYIKLVLGKAYSGLVDSWDEFGLFSPEISIEVMASAARAKPISTKVYADVMADAALDSLLRLKDEKWAKKKFDTLLVDLENGSFPRAKRIAKGIAEKHPGSRYDLLSEAVIDVFTVLKKIEWESYQRAGRLAMLRFAAIGVVIGVFDTAAKWLNPTWMARLRTLPGAIFGVLGSRRMVPFLWRPDRMDSVEGHSQENQQALEAKLVRLMDLDPSGEIAGLVARSTSGIGSASLRDHLVTEVLGRNFTGLATQQLFHLLENELARSRFSGKKVRQLVNAAYKLHASCASRVLETAGGLSDLLKDASPEY